MREIRPYGSEGGGAEANRLSLPLSSSTLRVAKAHDHEGGDGPVGSRWRGRGAARTAFPRGSVGTREGSFLSSLVRPWRPWRPWRLGGFILRFPT